jgi:hypothetical protein
MNIGTMICETALRPPPGERATSNWGDPRHRRHKLEQHARRIWVELQWGTPPAAVCEPTPAPESTDD